MITTRSREENSTRKEEGKTVDGKISKASSTSMTPWSRLKDPRIVPVPRAFGGKDRHSKVYTAKGLRDRRVRLSVPTAIQIYDLQARLGLSQPSKVVDWLLNAAKHDIDELPPLQIPPGNFSENHVSQEPGLKINHGVDWDYSSGLPRSNLWNFDATMRDKSNEISTEMGGRKDSWNQNRNEEEKQGVVEVHVANVSPTKFFPRPSHAFVPGLLNKIMPHNSFNRLNPSNFPSPQTEDFSNFNFVPLPFTSSLLSFGSQVLVRPPGIAQSDHFPYSHVELDPKQINHFHTLSSNSPSQIVYSLGQSTRPLSLETGGQSHSINDVEFPPE